MRLGNKEVNYIFKTLPELRFIFREMPFIS
jgi:hypothetical protein